MIKLVGIHKIYEDGNIGFLALKDISIDFKDDHFVCILGKSGSGKTTLLNIMGGLDNPSSGHMVINGELTTKFTKTQWDYFRNYKIGFIFQNFSLIEHLSVVDNVKLAIKIQGIKEEEATKRALEALDKVHILDQAKKLPKKLSGGQRQRVAIARALVNNPDVILADEPTGNLDKKTSHEVLEVLREISQEKLIVMVTHSKKIANQYADRIIELKDGSIISDTKPYTNEKVHIYQTKIAHTKFRFIDKIKHAFKNIRMKKWRSFLIALGLAIGVSSYILIDGISNGVKKNIKEQLTTNVAQPDLQFSLFNETLDRRNQTVTEYIDYLLNDSNIKAVEYERNLNLPIKEVDGRSISGQSIILSYQFIDDEKSEYAFFGGPYGDGRFPKQDNEIMVSYEFASSLYNIDNDRALWDKVKNKTLSVVTSYYYQIPEEIFYAEGLCQPYTYIDEETPPVGYNDDYFGSYTEQIATQKDLYNQKVMNGNQIFVCGNYYNLYHQESSEIKSLEEYIIVGMNKSSGIGKSFVTESEYMSLPDTFSEKYHEFFNYRFNVYLTDYGKDHAYQVKVKYPEATIRDVEDFSGITNTVIDVFVGIVQFIISLILVVSVITAGLMLLMVLLISVMERSREIGILRSLGATRSDILSVFVSESAVIGFLAGVLGVVLSIIIAIGANIVIRIRYEEILLETFNSSHINLVVLKPLSCIIAIIVCILFAMLFGLIPAIIASKKTPINALKRI